MRLFILAIGVVLLLEDAAKASVVHFHEPSMDRWVYPFNMSEGSRSAASTYGYLEFDGEYNFDNRDGQFLVAYDTSSQIPTGLGNSSYLVHAVTLTVTINTSDAFRYDPTYDSYASYLEGGVDNDPGRPIELYGVGYRGGYDTFTYLENSPYAPEDQEYTEGRIRNAYAMGFDENGIPRDVSNNVTDGFESNPWAIGQTNTVIPGDLVPAETVFTFSLNLGNPYILSYIQEALDLGKLDLIISSLHYAEQEIGGTFPSFFTKENILHDPDFGDYLAAQLSIEYDIIPEPKTGMMLLLAGFFAFLLIMRSHFKHETK